MHGMDSLHAVAINVIAKLIKSKKMINLPVKSTIISVAFNIH